MKRLMPIKSFHQQRFGHLRDYGLARQVQKQKLFEDGEVKHQVDTTQMSREGEQK